MPEFKGLKRLPGYLILFLQAQAKEFYSCTQPITSGWIRSKNSSVQIIHLTAIQLLFQLMTLLENQVSDGSLWINTHAILYFRLCFFIFCTFIPADLLALCFSQMIYALSEETCRLAAAWWRTVMITAISGLSRLLFEFLTQRKSKGCSMPE